jgi:hypothetical protein
MTNHQYDEPADEPSSPACPAHEVKGAYTGYAEEDELIAILSELLEAERSGVRVTHKKR